MSALPPGSPARTDDGCPAPGARERARPSLPHLSEVTYRYFTHAGSEPVGAGCSPVQLELPLQW